MLQHLLAHITKLLCDAEHIAMDNGSDPAPQAVHPLAPIPPLVWRRFSSSKVCCLARCVVHFCGHSANALAPLSGVCAWPRLRAIRYTFRALLRSIVTALQAPAPRSVSRYTALDLHSTPKVLTWSSAAAVPNRTPLPHSGRFAPAFHACQKNSLYFSYKFICWKHKCQKKSVHNCFQENFGMFCRHFFVTVRSFYTLESPIDKKN
jgi:hypothetical protein